MGGRSRTGARLPLPSPSRSNRRRPSSRSFARARYARALLAVATGRHGVGLAAAGGHVWTVATEAAATVLREIEDRRPSAVGLVVRRDDGAAAPFAGVRAAGASLLGSRRGAPARWPAVGPTTRPPCGRSCTGSTRPRHRPTASSTCSARQVPMSRSRIRPDAIDRRARPTSPSVQTATSAPSGRPVPGRRRWRRTARWAELTLDAVDAQLAAVRSLRSPRRSDRPPGRSRCSRPGPSQPPPCSRSSWSSTDSRSTWPRQRTSCVP